MRYPSLAALQRERGICSEPECEMPIAGWCATCDARGPFQAPKWCLMHLGLHQAVTKHTAYYPYDELPADPDPDRARSARTHAPTFLERAMQRLVRRIGEDGDVPPE